MHIHKPTIVSITLFLICMATPARAGIIVNFVGQPMDILFPDDASNPLTNSDVVTGTLLFDSVGSATVTGFTLSTTVGGGPGFTFDVPDVSNPGHFSVIQNHFVWGGPELFAEFQLTIDGELFGAIDGTEQISISEIGDLFTIDFMGAGESNALNMNRGSTTLSAVPEPSSMAVIMTLSVMGFVRRRHRNNRNRVGTQLR